MDKTYFVEQLVKRGQYYFLSRPRRFGKSLLLDTIKQAFLGNQEVFKGLYLEHHWDWAQHYPVIHIVFSSNQKEIKDYSLIDKIEFILKLNAKKNGVVLEGKSYADQFICLIEAIVAKYQKPVVILFYV